MNNLIYEIYLKNDKKTLIFCSEKDYKNTIKSDYIFTDMYIYNDDTLIDVINKVKINIIKHIPLYKSTQFENISGYLSADWDYYNVYNLEQYIKLNIFNSYDFEMNILNNKLNFIDKIYNKPLTTNTNIKLTDITSINNELVIGYYDRNITNNYLYYIGVEHINKLIENNGLIENELNNPISNYVNYDNSYNKTQITKLNFTTVNNENFKKFNYISLPEHLIKNPDTYTFLNNIYNIDNNNKLKLNKNIDNLDKILLKNINHIGLEFYNFKPYNISTYYNSIKLSEKCPLCIISYKEKKHKIFYKLHKKNGLPFIKQDILEKLTDKKKFSETRDFVLYKIYFIKNNIQTNYLFDVYIIEDIYFYINFDFINNNINNVIIEDIIININNTLQLLNLSITNIKKIENINMFHYLNNRNLIKINYDNEYISSNLNLVLNYNELELPIPKNNIHKFLSFLCLFNNSFDIVIKQLTVIYKNKLYDVQEITEENIFLKRIKPIPIYEAVNLTVKTSNIELYYKKSYNYESFNYLTKFFKNISTFDLKILRYNYSCIFSTEKTLEAFLDFLKYNNYEKYSDIYKTIIPNIEFILNNTPYKNKNYCEYIKRKNNQKTKLNINIDNDIFYINLLNINTFNEVQNISDIFNYYISFINNYDITSSDRLEFNQDIYINKNDTIFNKYNNIFNIYNTLGKSTNNEYYLYLLYDNIYKNTNTEDKSEILFLDDLDITDSDSDSDSDSEDEDTSDTEEEIKIISDTFINVDEDSVEKYSTLNNYKSKYNNTNNKETMKLIFGDAYKSCKLERRPSIIPVDSINSILEKENNDKIIINKQKAKPFTKLLDFPNNILDFTIKNNKIITKSQIINLYMGREYTFNIKYTKELNTKLVLLFNENNNFYIDKENKIVNPEAFINTNYDNMKDSNVYLEVYLENKTKINLDTYLSDFTNTSYYFKINFPQNSVNYIYKNNYKLFLYNIETNVASDDDNDKVFINLEYPFNYYYDKFLFGNYYFIYLPGKSENTQKGNLHPFLIDNMICCYSTNPHINVNLSNNNTKNPHLDESITFTKSSDLKLDNYKIAVIPKDIYTNISHFLNIPQNDDYYRINKLIQPYQAYRFGLTYNSNINNLLYCILNIIKLSNKKVPENISSIFKFAIIDYNNIKTGLIKCINNKDIISKNTLLKLNNNLYAKNEKNTSEKYDHYKDIKTKLSLYIENNFVNLDVNFIWNLCSIIFKINIIIFELKYTNVLSSSVKCPLVNNYNIYDFKNNNTCFILNFDNIYQPLTIPTLVSKNVFSYHILFNLKNNDSIINLNNLFDKCLLRYDNNVYNTLLINSVYHNVDYSKSIIIDTKEIYDIKNYINYIVINDDYIKLGLIFNVNNEDLFIPLNYIKHNINYNVIENDYKYIYKTKKNTDKVYIHDYTKTLSLIKTFFELHNNHKLNLNKKYITDGKYIIGIGLNIDEYVPITPYDITENIDLDKNVILSDISYLNHNIPDNKYIDLYNKFLYTDLYYEQFKNSIQSILITNKSKILNITDNNNLKLFINDLILDLFSFQDNMYLYNKKPTHNIENNFKLCNTLTVDNNCNDNCITDSDKCKYIITKYYYDIFLDFIVNDLLYNDYNKHNILNQNNNIINNTLNNEKYIILDNDNIDKYIIHDLYNKVITDKEYYLTGVDYTTVNSNKNNNDTLNNSFCSQKKIYNQSLNLNYFDFKPLNKLNSISYSNCIYYNLGKIYIDSIKSNYINNTRLIISDKLKELILNNTYNLFDVINYYISKNNSHIYTNVNDVNDLFNILNSDLHWITELDIYIFSLITESKIMFYKSGYQEQNSEKGNYMIMNEQFKKTIKIFVKNYYYKNLYYLVDSK